MSVKPFRRTLALALLLAGCAGSAKAPVPPAETPPVQAVEDQPVPKVPAENAGEEAEEPEAADAEPAAPEGEEPPASEASVAEAVAGEAQPEGEPAPAAEAVEEEDSAKTILELEIKTSTLTELAAWARSLGLSEGGTKEDLANRLRDHFSLPRPGQRNKEEQVGKKTITIESAKSTEYFTLEVVDEEYARLQGDVVVSLKDGEAVHRIRAWEILYNRTRNTMSATGGVEYIKEEAESRETFKGESITVNLDNWSIVFMGGASEKSLSSNTNEETAYRFAGTLITRNDEETTIMTGAVITNAKQPEPFWSITASKLWLLPGSDFAILNGVLKVGEVPMLYIPAFFFPSDEIVFHPVPGTRSREGSFVQTTTYILGRPVASSSSESSITKILGNGPDTEKIQHGIFLRSTGKKSQDPNTTRLSVLLDTYTNLGVYLGTELALPAKGIFSALDLSAGLGFTRNIYLVGTSLYTPFAQYDGSSEWNKSRMFGEEVPFRYRLDTKSSLSGKYGSLSWAFPFFADPYVRRDFLNRSEELDWFKMLKQGSAKPEESETASDIIGSYEWKLNGSLKPNVSLFSPYISSLSISSISTTLAFKYRDSMLLSGSVSPDRTFFFPDKYTIASISASIEGTPLVLGDRTGIQFGSSESASGAKPGDKTKPEEKKDPLEGIGVPRAPWETAGDKDQREDEGLYTLRPPALTQSFTIPTGGLRFTGAYRFSPTGASELQFRSSQANWPELEDVDWGETSSILSSFRTDGSTTFTLTDSNTSAYTIAFGLLGNVSWQDYSLMNDEAEEFDTEAEKDAALLRTRNATFFTTSSDLTTTIKPLYFSPVFGNSNLRYNLRNLLVKSAFNGSTTDPDWELLYGSWEKENIESHLMAMTLAASVLDKEQTLTLSQDLPPKDSALSLDTTMRVWISETNLKQRYFKPFEDEQKIEPLNFTETLRFAPNYSAQQYFVYDPDIGDFTSLTSSLTLNVFSLAFAMVRSKTYDFIPKQGWVVSPEDERFNPRDLRLGYKQTFKLDKWSLLWWKEILSFSLRLDSNLTFNLQRYTYSEFNFTAGFVLGISKFLDLSLDYTTKNSVFFRYFQDLFGFDPGEEASGEKNIFVDIWNSLPFNSDVLRRSSGFKMNSVKIAATHHLGDWDAVLALTLSPKLDQTVSPQQYKFNFDVSFVVKWIPIPEIKTDIAYKDEAFIIN